MDSNKALTAQKGLRQFSTYHLIPTAQLYVCLFSYRYTSTLSDLTQDTVTFPMLYGLYLRAKQKLHVLFLVIKLLELVFSDKKLQLCLAVPLAILIIKSSNISTMITVRDSFPYCKLNILCFSNYNSRGRTDKKLTITLVIRTFLSFNLANIFFKYGSRLFFKKAKKKSDFHPNHQRQHKHDHVDPARHDYAVSPP